MYEDDILQPLTEDTELIELQNVYKDIRPTASHIYNYLSNVIRRRSLEPNSSHFTIFVPYGEFKNGTFLGVEQGAVVMYTLEKDYKTLLEVLKKTKRITWSDNWTLYCMAKHHSKPVLDIVNSKGYQIGVTGDCKFWWLAKEKAVELSISCPDEVTIKPLESSHVSRINSLWPHSFPGSEKYLNDIITFGGGYGVFQKSDDLLIAWALQNPIGIGTIQTAPEYLRKGYGSLIAKYISKKIGERGCDPLGTVVIGNIPSESMFSKLGFEVVENGYYHFSKQFRQDGIDG